MCCNSVSKRFCNPFPLRPRLGTCAYFLKLMMMPTPSMLLCFLILSKGCVGTSATRFKRERERERDRSRAAASLSSVSSMQVPRLKLIKDHPNKFHSCYIDLHTNQSWWVGSFC